MYGVFAVGALVIFVLVLAVGGMLLGVAALSPEENEEEQAFAASAESAGDASDTARTA